MTAHATIATALKAYIETLGLTLPVYVDVQPNGINPPYGLVATARPLTPEGAEDGKVGAVSELALVDVYLPWRDSTTGKVTESATIADALVLGLSGSQLSEPPKRVYGVEVIDCQRLPDEEANVVHLALSVRIRRSI